MGLSPVEILSHVDITPERAYELFTASYKAKLGASWSKDKFMSRIANWELFGNHDGFIAVRRQRGGMFKLVGCAGSLQGIVNGLLELISEHHEVPIWGMMDRKLVDKIKKLDFIEPPVTLIKMLIPLIPKSVFGGVDYTINPATGGVTLHYEDVGPAEKFFVCNKAYCNEMVNLLANRDDVKEPLKSSIIGALKLIIHGTSAVNRINTYLTRFKK